jgi:hypothetical protein
MSLVFYLWQCMSYNLSCKVSFLYTSWMAELDRFSIKFCCKAGLSTTETLVLVQKAYGNGAVNRSNVFRRYSRFRDVKKLVDDDERVGRPKSFRTEVNIVAFADLFKNDHRTAPGMIVQSLNIPSSVVLRILKEDFGNRRIFFVPR